MDGKEFQKRIEGVMGHLRNAAEDGLEELDCGISHAEIALHALRRIIEEATAETTAA